MNELVIASNNPGKIRELRALLPPELQVLSLADIGFHDEIEEPYDSFEENAHVKAATVHRFSGKNVLADDSGLCVAALQGGPGVHSARYAGTPQNEQRNLQRLMKELEAVEDRRAWYKAVICLIWEGKEYFFEGICQGAIAPAPQGSGGFGYDPVFIPEGHEATFGELDPEVKYGISHRGRALAQVVEFIRNNSRQ